MVRECYWPISGKRLCKVYHKGVQCFRIRTSMMPQQMSSLPVVNRVTPLSTFGIRRQKPPTTTYLCVFVCFVTKTIHLELASDLSTASFLGALKRIVATRGVLKRIFSDDGTNFVGANSTLRELYDLPSSDALEEKHIILQCFETTGSF